MSWSPKGERVQPVPVPVSPLSPLPLPAVPSLVAGWGCLGGPCASSSRGSVPLCASVSPEALRWEGAPRTYLSPCVRAPACFWGHGGSAWPEIDPHLLHHPPSRDRDRGWSRDQDQGKEQGWKKDRDRDRSSWFASWEETSAEMGPRCVRGAAGTTRPPIGRAAAADLGPGVKAISGGCPSSSSSITMKVLRRRWFVLLLAAAAWAQDALGKGLFLGGESYWVWLPSLGRGSGQCPPGWAVGGLIPGHGSLLRGGGHG